MVTFYDLDATSGEPTAPVLFLDTLKVSTIEQTGEQAEAKGGKGNASLIAWDYGKEINVSLEDALFSAKSMAIMFGNGRTKDYNGNIMKTEQFTATREEAIPSTTGSNPYEKRAEFGGWSPIYTAPDGKTYDKYNPRFFTDQGTDLSTGDRVELGHKYFCTYDLKITSYVVEISATSFPGTYYVTGDTYARSEASGKDEFFQFIIPKAKVTSENTITLEADGDPSVFNMNLKVLRPADGIMMKLVKYTLENALQTVTDTAQAQIKHNHDLRPEAANLLTISISGGGVENQVTTTVAGARQILINEGIATAEVDDATGVITFTGYQNGSTMATIYDETKAPIKNILVTVTGIVDDNG
jgi:hypothetical protein